MFRFLYGLILGVALGTGVTWWWLQPPEPARLEQWRDDLTATGLGLRDVLQEKLQLLHLTATNIQEELARRGQVVRRAARDLGHQVADAATDARIVAAIKAKYVADPRLSALRISVQCSEGRVTLSGTVDSAEDVGRAVLLAMEADSRVREVVSHLQVKP